jgi:opacity protein-like surface antigen
MVGSGKIFTAWRCGCNSDRHMRTLSLSLLLLLASSLQAQDWSIRVGSGPFLFGDFAERTLRIETETGSEDQTTTLSAATRAGLAVDIEKSFSDRFAVRLEGTFARAPLSIGGSGDDDGVEIDAGELDIFTISLPLVFRINPRGTFRFHLLAGPAYAAYKIESEGIQGPGIRLFRGTRNEWGLAAGGGASWNFSETFAAEAQIVDVVSGSPFRKTEIATIGRTDFPRPHNVHTTIGLRIHF